MTIGALLSPVRPAADEERALYESAVAVSRTDRRRWSVEGNSAASVLNGLLTNDIEQLRPGDGCYAAALTPKGKIVADVRVFARDSGFLVDAIAAAGDGWTGILRKYVNPRLAKWREITAETSCVTIAGVKAAESVRALVGTTIEPRGPYSHFDSKLGSHDFLVATSPELDVPAYDLIGFTADSGFDQMVASMGITTASLSLLEYSRIAAGRPLWGRDMDESTLTQEANLDSLGAVAYDKGCYTGQETVARLHFRGHVNRHLRRIRFSADADLPSGAELFDASGKSVGDVRSSAIAHRHGGIALAMVRREVPDGATLTARWSDRSVEVSLAPGE